ncbi:MAG: lipid A biosynthesis acyltransferase, partial [Candidatus Competibacteraceae bacterium]|nr:lipid A biosynthesis acyltransferase [Candidatus Competibacteraceae bacterium]
GCPVIIFFGLYRGSNRYDIHFERLADVITLDRACRQQQLQHWAQRYAERLEHYTRSAPYNWFNFYDFWEET